MIIYYDTKIIGDGRLDVAKHARKARTRTDVCAARTDVTYVNDATHEV